ncbi:hypothetical protein [Streptomyces sp. NPDC002276]
MAGPCLESYGSGRVVAPVSIGVAHSAARWPEFTERAPRHGIVATFAVSVRRRDTLLGALNVFVATLPNGGPDGGRSELLVAQALADAAGLGLQNQRAYAQYRSLAGQLQEALSSRIRIERRCARRCRLPLDRVARSVIERGVDGAELRGP